MKDRFVRAVFAAAVVAGCGSALGVRAADTKVSVVEDRPGYNSWPMIQVVGRRLVCAYSRGVKHDIFEGVRGAFAWMSDDGGRSWSKPVCIADAPDVVEVPIGKGVDGQGRMLLWVRAYGANAKRHDLFRTADGVALLL